MTGGDSMTSVDHEFNSALSNIIEEYQKILDCISKDFFQQKTLCFPVAKGKCLSTAEEMKKIALHIVMHKDALDLDNTVINEIFRCLEQVRLSLERIMHLIDKKITRRVLFSKWAVDEISALLNCTRECLEKLSEYISLGKEEYRNLLTEQADRCLALSREYCNNHKNRFYEGNCLLESTGIYEPLLEEFRKIFKKIGSCTVLAFDGNTLVNHQQNV